MLPFSTAKYIFLRGSPFYVICNLWGIWILIYKPRQPQLQHLPYTRFVAFSISICSFIAVQKLAYEFVELESPLFFILSLIAYGFVVYKSVLFWIKYFTARLRKITDQDVKIPKIVFFSVAFLSLSTHLYFYFDFKKQFMASRHINIPQSQKKPKLSRKEKRQ